MWKNNEFEETRDNFTLTGDVGDSSVGQPPGATLVVERSGPDNEEIIVEMSIEEAFALRDMLNNFLNGFIQDEPDEDVDRWLEDRMLPFPEDLLPYPEDDLESRLMAVYESYNELWEDF